MSMLVAVGTVIASILYFSTVAGVVWFCAWLVFNALKLARKSKREKN